MRFFIPSSFVLGWIFFNEAPLNQLFPGNELSKWLRVLCGARVRVPRLPQGTHDRVPEFDDGAVCSFLQKGVQEPEEESVSAEGGHRKFCEERPCGLTHGDCRPAGHSPELSCGSSTPRRR